MDRRIFFMGVVGGFLLAAVLKYPLNDFLPGLVISDWPHGDSSLALGHLILGGLLLIGIGALTARLSGLRGRGRGATAGALAGLVAAWIVEMLWGGAAAGVWGAHPILMHGLKPAADNTEFIRLIGESLLYSHGWTFASIWISAAVGAGLGALGGFLAGAGGPPGTPGPFFWFYLSTFGIFCASANLGIVVTVLGRLIPSLQEAALTYGYVPTMSPQTIFTWPLLTNFVWLIVWQLVAWRSLVSVPVEIPRDHARRFTVGVCAAVFPVIAVLVMALLGGGALLDPVPVLGMVLAVGLAGLTFYYAWKLHAQPLPPAIERPVQPRWVVWRTAIGGFLLLISIYMGTVGSALNMVMLIVAPISFLTPGTAAVAASGMQSTKDLVNAAYMAHRLYVTYGGGWVFILSVILFVGSWLMRRQELRRKGMA